MGEQRADPDVFGATTSESQGRIRYTLYVQLSSR